MRTRPLAIAIALAVLLSACTTKVENVIVIGDAGPSETPTDGALASDVAGERDDAQPVDGYVAPVDVGTDAPDVSEPADTGKSTDTPTQVDSAPPPDAATSAEQARCAAGAPRLEWRGSAGCYDTIGVAIGCPSGPSVGGASVPFACVFQHVNAAGAGLLCIPQLHGNVVGWSDSGCSTTAYLDTTDYSTSSIYTPASEVLDGAWSPVVVMSVFTPASGAWFQDPFCAKQFVDFPYANGSGFSLSVACSIDTNYETFAHAAD